MTGGRCSQWSQGDLLRYEGQLWVLVSHDCDLAAELNTEPTAEWIPCTELQAVDGQRTFGKNPRILNLEATSETGDLVPLEIDARSKTGIDKAHLEEWAKPSPLKFTGARLEILRRWLGARYSRSAFPNSFEELMRKIAGRVDKLAKSDGQGIRGLYFDLDDGAMVERSPNESTYELYVYVVYPENTSDEVAAKFADDLKGIFRVGFCHDGEWSGINLVACDSICDNNFSLELALASKPWRMDHRSLSGTPTAAVMPRHE